MNLLWYYNRLRAMSGGEIGHRISKYGRILKWRRMYLKDALQDWDLPQGQYAPPAESDALDLGGLDGDIFQPLVDEANAYLQHKWMFFGLNEVEGDNIDWHADPVSGKKALGTFGFDIDYLDPQQIGSIKIIWEKNRHHHLTVLSAAYALTGDDQYSKEVVLQIRSWIDQNPLFSGVNWTHPLEHGIRLISWVWCERLLRGSKEHAELFSPQSPVYQSVYQQQRFIAETYCAGSSANNHLIGEMAGLYISTLQFPVGREAQEWRELSRRILEEELVKQTFESGLNREQAFAYHLFVLSFGLLACIEAEETDSPFSSKTKDALKNMVLAVCSLRDVGGNLPRYGDEDGGKAIQLGPICERPEEWLIEVGERYFSLPATGDRVTLAAAILAKKYPRIQRASVPDEKEPEFSSYNDAGVYVLASNRGLPEEVFVLADAGPHGYLSIAAHAHADALSFTMSVGGQPIIVDPGTYVYYAGPEWRRYFRGTKAHNTVNIDGLDQSLQVGAMMWSKRAVTEVKTWAFSRDESVLDACHDGYRHLGILHSRRMELKGKNLLVRDLLKYSRNKAPHTAEIRLHIHPDCIVCRKNDSVFSVEGASGVKVEIRMPAAMKTKILYAEPDGGWYSPDFMEKVPTHTLVAAAEVSLSAAFETEIEVLNES